MARLAVEAIFTSYLLQPQLCFPQDGNKFITWVRFFLVCLPSALIFGCLTNHFSFTIITQPMQHSRLNFIDFLAFPALTGLQTRRLKYAASLCVVFLLCWSLISPVVQAQESAVKWGKKNVKDKEMSIVWEFLSYSKTGSCILKGNNLLGNEKWTDFSLHFYDAEFSLKKVMALTAPDLKYLKFASANAINDKLLLVGYIAEKKSVKIYTQVIDLNTAQAVGGINEVAVIATDEKFKWFNDLQLKQSEDGQKVAILFEHPVDNSKKDNQAYEVLVFNSDFKKEKHSTIALPYKKREFQLKEFCVSNSGDVHLLSSVDVDEKYPIVHLFSYSFEHNKAIQRQIESIDNQLLTNVDIRINSSNDNLIFLAFSTAKEVRKITGAIVNIFSPLESRPVIAESTPIDHKESLMFAYTDSIATNADKFPHNIDIESIIPYSDGSMCVVGRKMLIHNVNSGGTYYPIRRSGDVFVLWFSHKGRLDKIKSITLPRFFDGNSGSYFLVEALPTYMVPPSADKKLHFYFNKSYPTLKEMKKISRDAKRNDLAAVKGEKLLEVVFDANGESTTKELTPPKDIDWGYPQFFGFGEGKVIVMAGTTQEYAIGTLTPTP
jgi:hypothetical protein